MTNAIAPFTVPGRRHPGQQRREEIHAAGFFEHADEHAHAAHHHDDRPGTLFTTGLSSAHPSRTSTLAAANADRPGLCLQDDHADNPRGRHGECQPSASATSDTRRTPDLDAAARRSASAAEQHPGAEAGQESER